MEDIIVKRIDQIHIMVVDQNGHPHTIIKDIINAKDEELLFSSTNESEERGIQVSLKCEGFSILIDADNN